MPSSVNLTKSLFNRGDVSRAIISFFVWMILNVSLSISNKWLFAKLNFRFPLFIIIIGTLCTFFGSFLILFVCRLERAQLFLVKERWKLLLVLAVVHGVDVGLENFSIVYISISLNQVIKATVPALTLVLSYLFEGKQYTKAQIVSTLVTVVGAAITVYNNPELENDGHIGVIASIFSSIGAAISTICLGLLLQDSGRESEARRAVAAKAGKVAEKRTINGITLGFASSIPSAMALLPPFAAMEYRKLISEPIEHEGEVLVFFVIVGLLALLYNLSRFFFIRYTEAHYSVLAGNVKVILLVFVSMAIFGRTFSPLNYAGMVISFSGFVSYSYFKYQQLKVAKVYHNTQLTQQVLLDETINETPL